MLRFTIIAVTLFAAAHQAYAFCVPGTVDVCFVNGVQGTRVCGANAMFGPCMIGFVSHAAKVEGAVVSDAGAPVANQEVAVEADGVTYRTVTDATGAFRLDVATSASALQLRVGASERTIAPTDASLLIRMP